MRGLNAPAKRAAVREVAEAHRMTILCLQETKKEHFDHSFLRKFCPRRFDKFEYVPSSGASGGLVINWCSSQFTGQVLHSHKFALTIKLTSLVSNQTWNLTNVYEPCEGPETIESTQRFEANEIEDEELSLFMGDFNYKRS